MGILDKIASALGPAPRVHKILVIGLDGSGKSTVINSLKPAEERTSGEIPATVGVQVRKKLSGMTHVVLADLIGGENQIQERDFVLPRHVRPNQVSRNVGARLL